MIYDPDDNPGTAQFEHGMDCERQRVTRLLAEAIIGLEEEGMRAESLARHEATMDRLDAWQDAFALVTGTQVGSQSYELALRNAKFRATARAPE